MVLTTSFDYVSHIWLCHILTVSPPRLSHISILRQALTEISQGASQIHLNAQQKKIHCNFFCIVNNLYLVL